MGQSFRRTGAKPSCRTVPSHPCAQVKAPPFLPPKAEHGFPPLLSLLQAGIPWVFSHFHPFSHNSPMKGSFSKHFTFLLKAWKCFFSLLQRPDTHLKAAKPPKELNQPYPSSELHLCLPPAPAALAEPSFTLLQKAAI